MTETSAVRIELWGHCPLGLEALRRRFAERGAPGLRDLPGEHVIVAEDADECVLVSSDSGAVQHYYAICEGRLVHADTVLGVLRRSGLPWRWHWPALADLIILDHVVGEDTLHPDVRRVPPAALLHFRDGALTRTCRTWEERFPDGPSRPDAALAAFNAAVAESLSDGTVVSMSGGFDSRAILSSALAGGARPRLLSMGDGDSTDVVVSRQIAGALGLELSVVALRPEDYLESGPAISALTNGTKTARHWHTGIYVRKAGLDDAQSLLIGSNGEFARSFYLDKGLPARLADRLAPAATLRRLWQHKLRKNVFRPEEMAELGGPLAAQFRPDAQDERLRRMQALCGGLLPGLDRFYLEQRVRNFIGNGLKLYSAHAGWRAPFLDPRWTREAWRLSRPWKLGSNWHRYAVAANYPRLMDFPEPGRSPRWSRRAAPLYWRPGGKGGVVSYADYSEWYRGGPLPQYVRDQAPLLSEMIDPRTVRAILDQHAQDGTRAPAVGLLLSLAFWASHLNTLVREQPDEGRSRARQAWRAP